MRREHHDRDVLGGGFPQQVETVDPHDVQDGQVISVCVHFRDGIGVGGRPIDSTLRGITEDQIFKTVQNIAFVVHGENAFAVQCGLFHGALLYGNSFILNRSPPAVISCGILRLLAHFI
jgi:hypothetical protein